MLNYCRLCAKETKDLFNLFSDDSRNSDLLKKIHHCLHLWIFSDDILPKTICNSCGSKISDFYDYAELCTQAQLSLIQIFIEKENESNELECNRPSEVLPTDEFKVIINDETDESIVFQDSTECNYLKNVKSISNKEIQKSFSSYYVPIKPKKNNSHIKEFNLTENNLLDLELSSQENNEKEFRENKNQSDIDVKTTNCLNEEVSNIKIGLLKWKCSACNDNLRTLSELKSHHEKSHNQEANFMCYYDNCRKIYSRYRSYARHIKLHVEPNKFRCDICGKCFSQKIALQSHKTVHSDDRPFSCSVCNKTFKQFSSLYLHKKSHLDVEVKVKYPCATCSKEFATKNSLVLHLKIHSGKKDYICDICGRSFIAKSSLNYHILSHTDEKPFKCPECHKGFKTSRLLSKHQSLHTGIKPHQCDVCGKTFRQNSALKEHSRIHTGAMPYTCEFCGKKFRFKGILTGHIRQHTGERPYACPVCFRAFTNWANFNKHMKRKHKDYKKETTNTNKSIPAAKNLLNDLPVESNSTIDLLNDNNLSNFEPLNRDSLEIQNLYSFYSNYSINI